MRERIEWFDEDNKIILPIPASLEKDKIGRRVTLFLEGLTGTVVAQDICNGCCPGAVCYLVKVDNWPEDDCYAPRYFGNVRFIQ